ncbi:MAG: hypothetical protein LBI79_00635 [Nitrososphaerota archaeon]|jgi:N-acetylneuraminic acid mutarotase|nr:hypothetical protein [Nitrososphaerota archaeon]
MNKLVSFMLLFFFITGSFATVCSSVSAEETAENSWNTKNPMRQPRTSLGVIAVDGKIYAIGGSIVTDIVHREVVGTNECYDPVTNTWITLAPMPTPRSNFAITAYQGKIYCIDDRLTEVYDIATDSWSTKAAMRFEGGRLYAHTVDGKIFVLNTNDFRLYMYDPVVDSWTEKTSIPASIATRAYVIVSTVLDDKIMVIGPFYIRNSNGWTAMENKVVVYDPKLDVWTEIYSAPATDEMFFYDVAAGVTTGLYAPKKLYIFQETETIVYDPINNTWHTAESMPTARRQFGVAVVDDVLYVIGGHTTRYEVDPDLSPIPVLRTEDSSVNEQYVPMGYQGTLPSDTQTPLNNAIIIAVAVILTVSIVATVGLFVYFKKRR